MNATIWRRGRLGCWDPLRQSTASIFLHWCVEDRVLLDTPLLLLHILRMDCYLSRLSNWFKMIIKHGKKLNFLKTKQKWKKKKWLIRNVIKKFSHLSNCCLYKINLGMVCSCEFLLKINSSIPLMFVSSFLYSLFD